MDLNRRDAFRPCSRDSSGYKGQFCFICQKKIIGIGPPLPFLGCMSSSAIWPLQNFSSTTYRPPLPSRPLIRYLKPSKFKHVLNLNMLNILLETFKQHISQFFGRASKAKLIFVA